jgi:hypothetical protein
MIGLPCDWRAAETSHRTACRRKKLQLEVAEDFAQRSGDVCTATPPLDRL